MNYKIIKSFHEIVLVKKKSQNITEFKECYLIIAHVTPFGRSVFVTHAYLYSNSDPPPPPKKKMCMADIKMYMEYNINIT